MSGVLEVLRRLRIRDVDILTFSSLYPNLVQPIHGIFVEPDYAT